MDSHEEHPRGKSDSAEGRYAQHFSDFLATIQRREARGEQISDADLKARTVARHYLDRDAEGRRAFDLTYPSIPIVGTKEEAAPSLNDLHRLIDSAAGFSELDLKTRHIPQEGGQRYTADQVRSLHTAVVYKLDALRYRLLSECQKNKNWTRLARIREEVERLDFSNIPGTAQMKQQTLDEIRAMMR